MQGPQREDHLSQPTLHVVDAGTLDQVVFEVDRHLLQGPRRPNRIAVTQQQLHRTSPNARARPRVEVAAAPPSRYAVNPVARSGQLPGENGKYLLLPLRHRGGRFRQGESLQEGDHSPSLTAEVVRQNPSQLQRWAPTA